MSCILQSGEELTLFPLLRQVHSLPLLPDSLKGLTFPELLVSLPCQGNLNKHSPPLSRLSGLIQELKQNEELSPLLSQLLTFYREYRHQLIELEGEERSAWIAGPLRLFARFESGTLHLFSFRSRGGAESIGTLSTQEEPPPLLSQEIAQLLFPHIEGLHGSIDQISSLALIEKKDWRGRNPLHHATLNRQIEQCKRLVELGVSINSQDFDGRTPLHLATLTRDLPLVQWILKVGGDPTLLTSEGKSALDFALESNCDEIAWLFLEGEAAPQTSSASSSSSSSSSSSLDFEGVHYRTFEAAYRSKNVAQQILSLEKLALIYLERRDFIRSAHLLNGAAALAINPRLQQLIFNQLERLEELFLFHRFGIKRKKEAATPIAQLRQELERVRSGIAKRLEEGLEVKEVQELLTKSYQALLSLMIDESIALLGRGYPDSFAVMGLGSMARREMSPYSDLEFAFLISNPSEENRSYFRDLNELLTLRVINLGETSFKLIQGKEADESLVPSGFSIDIGGLSPLGTKEVYELIGTPKELAYFQTEEWFSQHDSQVILVNAMRTVSCVMGDARLVNAYQKEISRHLDRRTGERIARLSREAALEEVDDFVKSSSLRRVGSLPDPRYPIEHSYLQLHELDERLAKDGRVWRRWNDSIQTPIDLIGRLLGSPLREHRALGLMRGYLEEFNPRLEQTIELRAFDIKKQLYRLPQSVISSLALFYDLKSNNTLEQIDELQARALLSKEGGDQLKSTIRSILKLRIIAHLFYKSEKEILYHSQQKVSEEDNLLLFDSNLAELVNRAYDTLISLHEHLTEFVKDNPLAFRDFKIYRQKSIYALSSDLAIFQIPELRPFITDRQELAKRSIALDPNNSAASTAFGLIQDELGNPQEAIRRFEEALSLLNEEHRGQPHHRVAEALRNLAGAYRSTGEFNKAIDLYNASIAMYQRLYQNKPQRDLGRALNELGELYAEMQQTSLASRYYLKAYEIYKKPAIKEMSKGDLARIEGQLIYLYLDLKGFDRAIEEYTRLLKNPFLSDLDRASTHQGLGEAYLELGELDRSVFHFNLSDGLYKEVYKSNPHPSQATPLIGLGRAYAGLKGFSASFGYCNQALEMMRIFYEGRPHPRVAEGLDALGEAYEMSEELEKAVESYNASLLIMREFYQGRAHRKTAALLKKLGTLYQSLNQLSMAIERYQEALSITRSFYQGKPHKETAELLMKLGELYLLSEESLQAIQYYEYSLEETRLVNGDFPAQAICDLLTKLKGLYSSLGDSEGAKRSSSLLRSYYLAAGNYAIEAEEFEIAEIAYAGFFEEESDQERVDDLESADVYMGLGIALEKLKKIDDAVGFFEGALDLYQSLNGDPLKRAQVMKRLGTVYSELNQFDKASDLLEKGLAIYRELGEEHNDTISEILLTLSDVYLELEEVEKSTSCLNEALSIRRSLTDELIRRYQALQSSLEVEDKS